jgi:hypothetical protein
MPLIPGRHSSPEWCAGLKRCGCPGLGQRFAFQTRGSGAQFFAPYSQHSKFSFKIKTLIKNHSWNCLAKLFMFEFPF